MNPNSKINDTSITKNSQMQQQEQENQQQEQRYQYYNTNTNTIITTQSRACSDLPGEEIMEQIAECYRANIGPMITQAAAIVIENALKAGMEPSTVMWAIEETGLASRPSPYYLRAVLRNWAEYGVAASHVREDWKRTNGMPWWKR